MSVIDQNPQQLPNPSEGEGQQPAPASPELWAPPVPGNDAWRTPDLQPASASPSNRNRIIALGAGAAVLIGGGVGTAVALSGHGKAKTGIEQSTGLGNAQSTNTSPNPAHLSPTSLPSSKEVSQTPSGSSVNIATVVAGEDIKLQVGDAVVPKYETGLEVDPKAALNAFLSEYSYFLSTPDETNANVALRAITTDPNAIESLTNLRRFWQSNHPNQMLWFWTDSQKPMEVTTSDNTDGTTTLATDSAIHFKPLTMPNGSWAAPSTFDETGAATLPGIELTYAQSGNGDNTLVGSKLGNVDGQGLQFVFPTY